MEVRTQQSGRLEDVSPLDLLQSLGIYRRAGHVLFFHAHGRSQLWFESGRIVDACSGALQGAAAVHRIVTHERGTFLVEVTGEARACVIETSSSALIFEAARRLDEGQRVRARLPEADVVLCRSWSSSDGAEPIEASFEGGASLGEVLERSSLGELETLERVAALVEAGRLDVTHAVREPALPALPALPADAVVGGPGPWPQETSQPFVPSPSYASVDGFEDVPVARRRWMIPALVGVLVAGVVAVAQLVGTGAAPLEDAASSLAVVGGPVRVIDATAVSVAEPLQPGPHEDPVAVGISMTRPGLELDDDDRVGPSPSSSAKTKTPASSPSRSRSPAQPELERTGRSASQLQPVAKVEDPGSLLAEARRAYASGQGASAHRLASRSQRLRPSDEAAELVAKAACQMQRPDLATEALRAVPLLRRGHVRSTCKRSHGVRLKLGRGGR